MGVGPGAQCWLLQDREWIGKMYLPTNCSQLQAAPGSITTSKLQALKTPFLNCLWPL